MSEPLTPCPRCKRHVLTSEVGCPFCQAELAPPEPTSAVSPGREFEHMIVHYGSPPWVPKSNSLGCLLWWGIVLGLLGGAVYGVMWLVGSSPW